MSGKAHERAGQVGLRIPVIEEQLTFGTRTGGCRRV